MPFATLAHEDRGNGPAIVFLHGHPFSRAMWASQLERLSDEFRVVAPDLPGYGESGAVDQIMSMRRFADTVVELLDDLEIARATVVGLSMGGLVAMELGLGYPERVAGLVLAATAIGIWETQGFGPIVDVPRTLRVVILSSLAITLGVQTFFASFFLSVLGLGRR